MPDPRGNWMFEMADGMRKQGIADETLRDVFFGRSLPPVCAAALLKDCLRHIRRPALALVVLAAQRPQRVAHGL